MATRNIRYNGDPILRKECRLVEEITERELVLIEDMKETMYRCQGVGLAAPQVGILKSIAVVDVGQGPMVMINPVIVESSGSQIDFEGCLSVKDVRDKVERPNYVKVKALNERGDNITIEGTELLARALCHEIDHLHGVLFIDKSLKER
ncbi:peptide deformylase [Hathewaya proteolytica DSM 3090]|uniref:Peptide deformylase n=1 Tax=Hathewaya proteolytica DSM 3090 TaxID=1121331 RepID=A0A1M6JAK6_9CLOT|nr:peptide deformylase [Hathewaya proteolytica]SHJ43745.1 peptide deformylase [Hathewaya proteolytica DSM 3090]